MGATPLVPIGPGLVSYAAGPLSQDIEETVLDKSLGTNSQTYTRHPIFCNTLNNISVLGHFASKGVSYEDAQVN
jgi:hypothetical protein